MAVVRDGAGLVPDPVTQEVQPPSEIDVLVEHEEPLVEPAHLAEELRPHEHRGARAEEDVLRRLVRAVVRALGLALVAHPEPRQRPVDVVDELPVPVEHLARDAGDRAITRQRLDRRGHPLRPRPGIVVEERDVLAGRVLHTEVAAPCEAGVGARLDDDGVRDRGPDPLGRVVAGRVLHDDQLELVRRPVHIVEEPEARDRVVRSAVVDQDYRHHSGPDDWVHRRRTTHASSKAASAGSGRVLRAVRAGR